MKIFLSIVAVLIAFTTTVCAEEFEKTKIVVTEVVDGDTIDAVILEEEKFVTIRFADIDCPEYSKKSGRLKKQLKQFNKSEDEILKLGKSAKEKLKYILRKYEKNIWLQETPEKVCKNNNDRLVGIVYAGDINLNEYMLKNAHCIEYKCSEE